MKAVLVLVATISTLYPTFQARTVLNWN